MVSKLLNGIALAALVMTATAPATLASDAPATKEECEKHADMKWDADHGKCVHK